MFSCRSLSGVRNHTEKRVSAFSFEQPILAIAATAAAAAAAVAAEWDNHLLEALIRHKVDSSTRLESMLCTFTLSSAPAHSLSFYSYTQFNYLVYLQQPFCFETHCLNFILLLA